MSCKRNFTVDSIDLLRKRYLVKMVGSISKSMASQLVQAARIVATLLFISLLVEAKSKDERDCEVCIKVLDKFKGKLNDDDLSKMDKLEKQLKQHCKSYPKGGKENRFCYYIGGTDDAATSIIGEVTRPLSYHMPVVKICQKLKTKDSQICELRFDVKPDFSKLSKMRVGELKKILSSWNEDNACRGCAEKSDFVKKVKELLPKYEPEEYKKLMEKSEL